MKIAIIGIGKVGFAIANHLQKKGHHITAASNNPDSQSVKKALAQNPAFVVQTVQKAVDAADIAVLATPFQAIEQALQGISFKGKTLIDCTNPIGPGLTHGLNNLKSGAERVQELAPDSRVVKAFSIYGVENLVDSSYPGHNVKPVMLIAGDDPSAKSLAAKVVEEMGFSPKDAGALSRSLHLEHMTLLWVKMVRVDGHNPHLVWAALEK